MDYRIPGRVLVTSGPTRAYVDRIRYFSNTSSGALGALITKSLTDRNMPVILLRGPGSETPDVRDKKLLESHDIVTVENLIDAVHMVAARGDIKAVVHAMAVLDYIPEFCSNEKKKSGADSWEIKLVKTPKVIGIMRGLMPDIFFVGFKLESGVS